MENFNELKLPEALMEALAKMEFSIPTPIQAQAIPVAMEGNDILGSAQTGTGKTAAFGIPLVAHLLNNDKSAALIMTPTRELAVQVMQMIKKLTGHSNVLKTAQLIGGENMFRQFSQLEAGPRIIVGTPGRINDHLARKSLKLSNVDFLVLDETDRMLDMGFGVQIDKILTYMPQQRQTLMFSATLPKHIVNLSNKYTRNAVRIAVGSTTMPIKAIKQEVLRVSQAEKYATLTQQLDARTGSIIVFVRTKHGADRLARKLERESHSADAIHGDLRQNKRDKVIRMFREKRTRILVATDVAARGLDIPHIEHVINYDLPQCPEDYIHRIGRTARAGAEGEALCLVSPEEGGKWIAIERLMGGESADAPHQKQGNGRRSRNSSGYGRKNDGGFKQGRQRKPHRKGQSWQKAHDDRKAEAGAQPQQYQQPERAAPTEQKFERKFERRDEKTSFRGNREDKPWQKKREGGSDRPYQKREGGNDRPRGDKPWQKREGGSDRPRTDKPWQKKREGGSDRPYQKREGGSDRPFQKREGGSDRPRTDKPWQKREGGSDKPWQKKREGGGDRPFQKREGGSDKPWQKRERTDGDSRPDNKSVKPWHKKREGGSDRPFQKREGGSEKRFGGKPGGSKPWHKKSSGGAKNRDGNQPFRRNRDVA